MKTLPEFIKEIRAMGKTQVETAKLTGFSQAYISEVERGEKGTKTPYETLERVKAVYERLKAQH